MKKNIVIIILAAFVLMSQIPVKHSTVTHIGNDLNKAAIWVARWNDLGYKVIAIVPQSVASAGSYQVRNGNLLIVMSK